MDQGREVDGAEQRGTMEGSGEGKFRLHGEYYRDHFYSLVPYHVRRRRSNKQKKHLLCGTEASSPPMDAHWTSLALGY